MDGFAPQDRFGPSDFSDELGAIFEAIAQDTGDDGPRFTPDISRRLARDVVCRTYAGAIYELCHFAQAADQAFGDPAFGTQGLESLLWGHGPIRAREFRRHFEAALNGSGADPRQSLTMDQHGIRITYPDGEHTTSFGRMPYLAAVMEFLVSALGYATLEAALHSRPATMASRSQAASAITREVYAFLKPHLPPVHAQRKFRLLMAFLERRFGGGVGPEDLDDQAVLDFWIFASTSTETNVDFRTFKTVFQGFIRLRDALAAARDHAAIKAAASLGADRDHGEIDPAELDAALDHIEARRAPLEQLLSPPANAVKVLNKRETAAIEIIIEAGEAALALPLSVMRTEIFGAHQARITQSLRNGALRNRATVPPTGPSIPTYRDHARRIDEVRDHIEDVLYASFHVLASARHPGAIAVLLGLAPEIDLRPLAPLFRDLHEDGGVDDGGNVITLTGAQVGQGLLAELAAHPERHPALAPLLDGARAAARRIARKGFRASANIDDDRDRIEGFAVAGEALFAIRKQIDRFRRRLERVGGRGDDWDRRHRADRQIFFAHFRTLYGDVQ